MIGVYRFAWLILLIAGCQPIEPQLPEVTFQDWLEASDRAREIYEESTVD